MFRMQIWWWGSLSIPKDSYFFRMFRNGNIWAIIWAMWNPADGSSWYWGFESPVSPPTVVILGSESCGSWRYSPHLSPANPIPSHWSPLEALTTRHSVSILSRVNLWSSPMLTECSFLCQSIPDSAPCPENQVWIQHKRLSVMPPTTECSGRVHPMLRRTRGFFFTGVWVCVHVCVCVCMREALLVITVPVFLSKYMD